MENFKSKYIYLIFVLRVLLLSVLLSALSLVAFIGIPSLIKQGSIGKAIGLCLYGFGLVGYLLYMLGRSTFTERYDVVVENGVITLKDNFFGGHIKLDENFKGYSISNYFHRVSAYNFKTVIFYFENGLVVELPQFLYWNFKHIQPVLENCSLNYLGQEPFKWKNLISRKYFFK